VQGTAGPSQERVPLGAVRDWEASSRGVPGAPRRRRRRRRGRSSSQGRQQAQAQSPSVWRTRTQAGAPSVTPPGRCRWEENPSYTRVLLHSPVAAGALRSRGWARARGRGKGRGQGLVKPWGEGSGPSEDHDFYGRPRPKPAPPEPAHQRPTSGPPELQRRGEPRVRPWHTAARTRPAGDGTATTPSASARLPLRRQQDAGA